MDSYPVACSKPAMFPSYWTTRRYLGFQANRAYVPARLKTVTNQAPAWKIQLIKLPVEVYPLNMHKCNFFISGLLSVGTAPLSKFWNLRITGSSRLEERSMLARIRFVACNTGRLPSVRPRPQEGSVGNRCRNPGQSDIGLRTGSRKKGSSSTGLRPR